NTTYTTYNSLSLPQVVTEPPTAAHSSTADSTTTGIYDADGDLVTQNLPGGVQINSSYDALGNLTSQSGTGASATTATRTFTYDSAGRLATDADAASGTTGTYSYNTLDQVTQISYGSGNNTQSFGYDSLHRLNSDTVKTTSGSQVASIGYGYNANDDITSMTT